jgi:hypothetical protein
MILHTKQSSSRIWCQFRSSWFMEMGVSTVRLPGTVVILPTCHCWEGEYYVLVTVFRRILQAGPTFFLNQCLTLIWQIRISHVLDTRGLGLKWHVLVDSYLLVTCLRGLTKVVLLSKLVKLTEGVQVSVGAIRCGYGDKRLQCEYIYIDRERERESSFSPPHNLGFVFWTNSTRTFFFTQCC